MTLVEGNDEKGIISSKGRKVKRILKEYEVDKGERGVYNSKNRLNDLTGREWTFFINSVQITDFARDEKEFELWKFLQESIIETRYPTNGKDSVGHNLRKIHPSPKPPQLIKDLIAFFTKEGGWILDPFMGVGGTLLGASLLESRNAVGIELEKRYIDTYKEVCKREALKEQLTLCDDARNILNIDQIKNRPFDLILTDPPYADMLSRKRTGGDRKDKGAFTSDERDLGNVPFEQFFYEFRGIMEKAITLLKNKGYLVIFCKDMQPTNKYHNMLHSDIVNEICKIKNIYFKGYKIWYDKTINLYPYGYPFSYVSNQLHQFILIFRKEE
ncbi:type IIS restriction-modification system DNA methyltransferase [Cuniculiplasma divulgatum]|uniref:Type II methyltransferase n=2 Tax=Cuniculiplasma divulgatum TaxID=1673428 RepID=A0A1R4A637_9ARCH|nr:type IIS restriction-modification system DNA methyltransferase [Cuniculiplasma divulgatum]